MGSQSSQPSQQRPTHQAVSVDCKSENAEYLRLRAVYFACKTHPEVYQSLNRGLSVTDKYAALCKIDDVILPLVSNNEILPVSATEACVDKQDYEIIAAYVNAHYETGRCSKCK